MTLYQLRPHVRACKDGFYVVFLDLRRDKYWSVPARTAPGICGVIEGEGEGKNGARLIELKLIEPANADWKPPRQRCAAPQTKLVQSSDVTPSLLDFALFAAACWRTSRSLSFRRLDLALKHLAGLKRGAKRARANANAEQIVAIFEKLRPWYPRERVCLFDAFALMRFMLARGLAPCLVLGVRTAPFAAHCWVEWQGMLVNDTSDYCASFTPIAWV